MSRAADSAEPAVLFSLFLPSAFAQATGNDKTHSGIVPRELGESDHIPDIVIHQTCLS